MDSDRRTFLKYAFGVLGAAALSDLSGCFFSKKSFAGAEYNHDGKGGNMKMPYITLYNGISMPAMGYGTWNLRGYDGETAVYNAIKCGYRLIDTASLYNNEKEVGEGVKRAGVDREELFITTKLWNEPDPIEAVENSLKAMNLDYVDLYLIHWPKSSKKNTDRWNKLEDIYKSGKSKAIGVSNFSRTDLIDIMNVCDIAPMVNQIEIHPFYADKDTVDFCRSHNIAIEAYTPLGNLNIAMKNKTFQNIALKYGKTIPQIFIKWSVQNGFIPIPKSSKPLRMKENIDIFDFSLSEEDMRAVWAFTAENRKTL
ncbi:MAG: aldo/keto reductase [Mucispirillum sp.]|nr:aldo/keto reductase [Mucispirillum sp.]